MSWMFEVYYKSPVDLAREETISRAVSSHGGELTLRELPNDVTPVLEGVEAETSQPWSPSEGPIILTFEFASQAVAEEAAAALRADGEHVEGPCDYGDG
jgi:hypothetical protein